MSRVLVTGGHGFVGANLVHALHDAGHDVVALDTGDRMHPLVPGNVRSVRGDIRDVSTWSILDEGFDAVFHQAACTDTTVTDESFMMDTNAHAFVELLNRAIKQKIDVIYASSAAVYGAAASPQTVGKDEHPLNVYGVSKLKMDEAVRAILKNNPPIKIIGLRYFNVYGPGETHKNHMASMIYKLGKEMVKGKHPRIFTDGSQSRDQIFVEDIVQANLKAFATSKEKSGIYNAGTGAAVSFNQIIAALNAALHTNLETEYFENPYSFYQEHTQADIAATRTELGFDPQFTLESGIHAYVQSGAFSA